MDTLHISCIVRRSRGMKSRAEIRASRVRPRGVRYCPYSCSSLILTGALTTSQHEAEAVFIKSREESAVYQADNLVYRPSNKPSFLSNPIQFSRGFWCLWSSIRTRWSCSIFARSISGFMSTNRKEAKNHLMRDFRRLSSALGCLLLNLSMSTSSNDRSRQVSIVRC